LLIAAPKFIVSDQTYMLHYFINCIFFSDIPFSFFPHNFRFSKNPVKKL